jgi:phosphate transport system substrate-binding protein
MMKNKKWTYRTKLLTGCAVLLSLGILSCNMGKKSGQLDETPTRGNIEISIDESFKLLFDTQLYTFHALYKDAHITARYKPEIEVVNDFLTDSVRTVVSTYKLSKEEEDILLGSQIIVRTTCIAYDAIALIINPGNPDSLLLSTDVESIFRGKVRAWSDLNDKNHSGTIKIVFDNVKSGNVRYFQEKYALPDTLPANFMSAQSNEEVINYVEQNTGALGILSVNWISDRRDTVSEKFLSRIRVCAVSPEYDPESGSYYKPYQAYIADKSYPYVRDVYMLNRETFTGLGMGFVQFVAGDKGQRIVLKSRLVPATMPVRIVNMK